MDWELVLKICIVSIVLTFCLVIVMAIVIAFQNDRAKIKRGEDVMKSDNNAG